MIARRLKSAIYILVLFSTFAGCRKTEPVFEYEKPEVVEPPRVIISNPDDVKPFQLTYRDSTFKEQLSGIFIKNETEFSSKGTVTLTGKIGSNTFIEVSLPLNDSSFMKPTKYVINKSDTTAGTGHPIYFLVAQKNPTEKVEEVFMKYNAFNYDESDTSKFEYNLVLTLNPVDTLKHAFSGFLDTLQIKDKSSGLKEQLITKGDFSVYYNYAELTFDGVKSYIGFLPPFFEYSNKNGGWPYESGLSYMGSDNSTYVCFTYDPDQWTTEKINAFNEVKGKGIFEFPFTNNVKAYGNSIECYPPPTNGEGGGTHIPSQTVKMEFTHFFEGQFVKGNISTKLKKINPDTGNAFVEGGKEFDFAFDFSYRIIYWEAPKE